MYRTKVGLRVGGKSWRPRTRETKYVYVVHEDVPWILPSRVYNVGGTRSLFALLIWKKLWNSYRKSHFVFIFNV